MHTVAITESGETRLHSLLAVRPLVMRITVQLYATDSNVTRVEEGVQYVFSFILSESITRLVHVLRKAFSSNGLANAKRGPSPICQMKWNLVWRGLGEGNSQGRDRCKLGSVRSDKES